MKKKSVAEDVSYILRQQKEVFNLLGMVKTAFDNYKAENWSEVKELPLNDNITLDTKIDGELVAYAVTKFSVVCTNGKSIKFFRLGLEDILNLQKAISNVYDINIPE